MSDEKLASLTVEILKDIRQGVQDLRADNNERFERLEGSVELLRADTNARFDRMDGRIERMDGRFERMDERFARMERATIHGFEGVHSRLESIRDLAGERWRDHEHRIRALESRDAG